MKWSKYKETLERAGTRFDKGLSDSEIEQIETSYKFKFPPDLREFLQFALPVGKGWVDWRSDSFDEIKKRLDWPYEGMCFDIEFGDFWLKEWGEKPDVLEAAFEVARAAVDNAPKLIPIYSHRYIPDHPSEAGNPVFSVYQTDIIIYGETLPIYLENEFSHYFGKDKDIKSENARNIEFWPVVSKYGL